MLLKLTKRLVCFEKTREHMRCVVCKKIEMCFLLVFRMHNLLKEKILKKFFSHCSLLNMYVHDMYYTSRLYLFFSSHM